MLNRRPIACSTASTTNRVVANATALLFTQVVTAIANLVLVPLYLSRWSTQAYGEWTALSSAVAYLATADMGMNMAAGNALIEAYERKDWSSYQQLQASALLYYIGVAATLTLIALLVVTCLPLSNWLGIVHAAPHTVAITAYLMAIRLAWQMPAGQIWNIFRTTGHMATSQWIVNAQQCATALTSAVVIVAGGQMIAVAMCHCLTLLASCAIAWLMVQRSEPALLPKIASAQLSTARQLVRPSVWFGVITFTTALTINGPVLVIAHVLGGKAVATFAACRTLINLSRQLPTVLCWAVWPEVTRLYAVQDRARLRLAHTVLVGGYLVCSGTCLGVLWFAGMPLVALWTRSRVPVDPMFLRALLLYTFLQSPWVASSIISGATNRHVTRARCELLGAGVGILLVATLVSRLGLLAVPVGLFVGEVLSCYHFILRDGCMLVGESYAHFARRTWRAVIAVAGLVVTLSALVERFLGPANLGLRLGALIATALAGAVSAVWITFLTGEDTRIILRRCSTLLRRSVMSPLSTKPRAA